jgi:YesN/AraC family two-component response regulator
MKLLLVDDHKAFCEGLRLMLSRARPQLEVSTASTAEQALHILSEAKFDLVVADVRLPVHDGFWLCSEVKARFPSVELLLMSAEDHWGQCPADARFLSKWAGIEEWAGLLDSVAGG